MKLTRNKIRKLHKQKIQSLKRIKYGNKPKHYKKHNNTFRQKNRIDDSRFGLSHLFNKTLKSYIPAKELARINKKYKENRYQRRIRKMIPDGKRNGIMTGGASLPLPDGWEVLFDTQNRPYYGNQTLKITQWVYPGVLPPGWEVLFDANRQPFYGNRTLGITQWIFPSAEEGPAPLSPATNTMLPKKEEIKEVDARDSVGNWYKAYIIKRFNFDDDQKLPAMLRVHFVGWGIDTDEYIPVVKQKERIKPRTPDAKTGQLTGLKDTTVDGVIALYTETEMNNSKGKAEEAAKKFKEDYPSVSIVEESSTDEGGEGGEDGEGGEGGEGGEKDEKEEKDKAAAAEAKPAGKCSDKIKTPYAQMITLQVKADDEGEMSVIVNPVSTGIDGLPGILARGQEPPVTPGNAPAGGQQPPVAPGNAPAGGQQPPVTPGSGPGPGNTAAVGGRHTRRKKAKKGNKRKKMTRSQK